MDLPILLVLIIILYNPMIKEFTINMKIKRNNIKLKEEESLHI